MNKYFSYFAAMSLAVTITACSSEQDNVFDQSAAERLNNISGTYSTRLTDSKGGWVMEYYPYTDNEDFNTGVGYLIMNRYNTNGSVYTVMKNKASRNAKWEDTSAWQVITDMGPVLTYNTWNKCYGRFTDPLDIDLTTGSSNDESGKGYQGDYEFVMVDVPENGEYIMLKGKKRGIYQRMTRLPEDTDFETYLDDIATFNNNHFVGKLPYEFNLTDNEKSYKVNHMGTMRPTIYPEGKDSVSYGFHMPYLVTKKADQYYLRFKDTVMVEGTQMEQEFVYNSDDDKFYGVKNSTNVISSPYADAISFVKEKLDNNATFKTFRKQTAELSDKMKQYLDAASNAMHAKNTKYQIDSISVRNTTDLGLVWLFRYQSGSSAKDIIYKYDYQIDGNTIAFTFKEAEAVNGTNIMNSVPEIKTLLTDVLARKFIVEKYITLFNLRKIRLVAEDDKDLWFIINY